MTDFGLAEKVAIVTGGAGGLGRAFASAFLQAGARVTIADIDEGGACAAAAAIGPGAKRCIPHAVDITDEASVAGMAARTLDAFGGIDILVNNAALYGAAYRKPFFDISAAEWDRVLAVNLKGAFLCSKAVYPHMRSRGGKIINVASASVMSGSPLWLHYVSSKGGIIAMTRALAREMGENDITVNAIAPGIHADRGQHGGDRGCGELRRRPRRSPPRRAAHRRRRRRAVARFAAQQLCYRANARGRRRAAISLTSSTSRSCNAVTRKS